MAEEGLVGLVTGSHIPQDDGLIITAGGQSLAIGTAGHAVHATFVAAEGAYLFGGSRIGNVPQDDVAVLVTRGQNLGAGNGAEGQAIHSTFGAAEGAYLFGRGRIGNV